MPSIPFNIGDTLNIQEKESNVSADKEPVNYKARVAELSENNISIEMPLSEEGGLLGSFPAGSEIEVWFYAHDGAKYSFVSLVLGIRKEIVPLTLISHPSVDTIKRIQRREFLRVDCYEEVAIHPLTAGEFNPFLAKVVDLSGGGLAFTLGKQPDISTENEIKWWLALPQKTGKIVHPTGTAKLIRIIEPDEPWQPYICPIEFTGLVEKDREEIIKYCYERQLEIKKKGVAF